MQQPAVSVNKLDRVVVFIRCNDDTVGSQIEVTNPIEAILAAPEFKLDFEIWRQQKHAAVASFCEPDITVPGQLQIMRGSKSRQFGDDFSVLVGHDITRPGPGDINPSVWVQ